ncbi:glycosyltransferase [Thalassotalea ponticola]|uniref:glycosyltransferase n=1 Tax=Thalassotalea ponticola TaxID=1523392 RepID=UPI0025B57263|nr:glycosyltransferase [Thalassotalea ponticola]MDN3651808.1 glycosyltransferase [Thalassotalea ponticola]
MQNLFKQAALKYTSGDYDGALALYQQARDKFGDELVRYNIALCEQKLGNRVDNTTTDVEHDATWFNTYFDKVYVVNLEHDLAKRFKMTRQLTQCHIEFELFTASNGYADNLYQQFVQYQQTPNGALEFFAKFNSVEKQRSTKFIESPGAWGYLHTYIRLLRQAKESGYKRILILEDDVILADNFFTKFKQFATTIPSDWKVLQLGASQYNWQHVNVADAQKNGFYKPSLLDTCGSFAIAIDVSIVDELIELASTFEAPFDHLPLGHIYQNHSTSCFVAFPNLVMPDVSDSSIRDSRCQIEHAQLMKWDVSQFEYPQSLVSIGVVVESIDSLRYFATFAPANDRPFLLNLYANTSLGMIPLHNMEVAQKYAGDFQALEHSLLPPDCDLSAVIKAEHVLSELDIVNFISNQLGGNNRNYTQLCELPSRAKTLVDGRISVIIPTYGRAESLHQALLSVVSQCYDNTEVIVVDDNGLHSDNQERVAAIVQDIKDHHPNFNLHYIVHPRNRNGSAARNTGFLASTGEYVCFLDDDDVYLPGRLTLCVDKLKSTNADVGAVYCGYINGNEQGQNQKRYVGGDLSEDILLLNYQNNYLHTNTVTYKRAAVTKLNGFDESYIRHQDLEFNLRFFQHYKIDVVAKPLVHIRPMQVTHENKVYNETMMAVKFKFLTQFHSLIASFSDKIQRKIYQRHWHELLEFSSSRKALKQKLKQRDNRIDLNLFK